MERTYCQELRDVFALIREKYPRAFEYSVEDGQVIITDLQERVLGTITVDQLTDLWNGKGLS